MDTNPNQKVITVKKALADKDHTYTIINKDCLMRAASDLTHNELKIFLYLASNQPDFELALSSSDIATKMNANKRKIQESINTLIEKGYLVATGANTYDFIEDGGMSKKDTPMHEKDTGVCPSGTQGCVQKGHRGMSKKDTEILHNTTYNNTSTTEDKKKRDMEEVLESMSCSELEHIKDMCKDTPYTEIASRYNMKRFEASKFYDIYESVHREQREREREQYEREHAEEIAAQREEERKKREEDEQINRILFLNAHNSRIKRNNLVTEIFEG